MTLRGCLDEVGRREIRGWASDTDAPDRRVSLVVSANGQVIGRCLANRERGDLATAGIGDGRHAFSFRPGGALSPLTRYEIAVRREGDGAHLAGSPAVIEAAKAFDASLKDGLTTLLTAAGDAADRETRIAFLTELLERLRQEHATSERDGGPAEAAAGIPRALVIDEEVPALGRDAGSNAVMSHMASLRRLGFEVSFVPATMGGDPAALDAAGIPRLLRPTFASVEEVLARSAGTFALVYLHRATVAWRYTGLVRHHHPKAHILYSVADLHFLRLARQAAVEDRPELRRQSGALRAIEFAAARQADAVVTHSTVEASLLGEQVAPDRVHVVPWAIPLRPTAVPLSKRRGFAFVGYYGHKPNVDAARWLVEAVVPELARLGARLPCLLVGRGMPDHLRRLAGEGVEAVGELADLAQAFDRVRLTVAPLAFGAGAKGKVLDSLAAGIPCICSPAAAEGLGLPPLLADLVASSPAEMARAIRRLHDDDALNRACSAAGLAYIESTASEASVDRLMQAAVGRSNAPEASPPL